VAVYRFVLIVGVVLVALGVAACGTAGDDGSSDADSQPAESTPPIGTGKKCDHKLSRTVTFDYLSDQGLTPAGDKQTAQIALAGAIAEVCHRGPATLTVR